MCNKSVVYWRNITDEIGTYECSVRFYDKSKINLGSLLKGLRLNIFRY